MTATKKYAPRNKSELGNKFGKLTVTRYVDQQHVMADCDCGTKDVEVRLSSLRSGNTRSCGCLRKGNKGRPPIKKYTPSISLDDMVINTFAHIDPIRAYLKTKGIIIRGDGSLIMDEHVYHYPTPYHALAHAILKGIKLP